MRDQRAVDQHIQRFARQTIQLDHRALVELQQVANVDIGAAHFHGDRHRNVENHIQVGTIQRNRPAAFRHAAKLFHGHPATRVPGVRSQQRINISLTVASFAQCSSPFIGQCLVFSRRHIVFISHRLSSARSISVTQQFPTQTRKVSVALWVRLLAGPSCPCASQA